jgi:ABC-type multidrug transport system fused ATPase/permease subunit
MAAMAGRARIGLAQRGPKRLDEYDPTNTKIAHRVSARITDDDLLFLKQIGMRWARVEFGDGVTPFETIRAAQERFERHGIRIYSAVHYAYRSLMFFDSTSSLITLIALLFAGALGRMFFYLLLPLTNTTFVYTCGALLRKNMLARILQRPGARALPSSSGEAVSRFRDDIDETLWSVMYFNDVIALTAFTVVGLTIMMTINAWITLAVLLPSLQHR